MAFVWFLAGVACTLLASALWRRLAKRPVPWANRGGRLRVVDLDDEPERIAEIRQVVLTPVDFVHAIPEDWGKLDPC